MALTRRRPLTHVVGVAAVVSIAGLLGACGEDAAAPSGTGLEHLDPARVGPQGRVAQFVVECELSHTGYNDPIVYPHDAGASHLHTFFGNERVDEDPDYERIAGAETSCEQRRDTASYWAPALIDAAGEVVEPVKMTGYYRPGFGVDPAVVQPYPAGLMMVAGDALAESTQSLDVVAWSCGTGAARSVEPTQCPANKTLRLIVNFPDCWDGENLRGNDAEPVEVSHADGGITMLMQPAPIDHTARSVGGECPVSHPVPIPMLQLAIDYPPVAPDDLSLASGDIRTAHADFWNVWDQDKLEEEVELCLNADRVCGVTS